MDMILRQPTDRHGGVSLNQARVFPRRFHSWLGGVVLSLDEDSMVLGGQGVELRALYSGGGLSIGDKVLIKISDCDFREWLNDCHHLVCEVIGIKILTPRQGSQTSRHHFLGAQSYRRIECWNCFVDVVKKYFRDKGFIETPTPSLVECPGLEPVLEPFATILSVGECQRELFLSTSPELHLKKLLAQGWSEIFEVKPCFRNGELSPHHQPEFTMLEWYRAYDSLDSVAYDVRCLISELKEKGFILGSVGDFQQRSISQLFLEYTDLKLTPLTTRDELIEYCHYISQPVDEGDTWDDIFHLIFIARIEAHLGEAGPEFIYNFPASQAALAQINGTGWADRFEFYWRGIEIGNAFNELLDPVEQRKRFKEEMALREQMGRTKVPIDEEFMEALERGIPPCAGMAVGLERLFLACQDIDELEKLRLFPFRALDKIT